MKRMTNSKPRIWSARYLSYTSCAAGSAGHAIYALPLLVLAMSSSVLEAQCPTLEWRKGVTELVGPHGSPGISGALGVVHATVTWDPDGPGGMNPWLVVGGDFELRGDFFTQNIAAWDGERWRPMGVGFGITKVFALAIYNSGNGDELYVGGEIFFGPSSSDRFIARWDGLNWVRLGNGIILPFSSSRYVAAMSVFDDGTGPKLYFSGNQLGVYSWDGVTLKSISGVGNGRAMAVFDDGSGPALYVGGRFQADLGNGVLANNIAKWNGTNWSALGTGLAGGSFNNPSNAAVYSLAAFRDANGPALYVGGEFSSAGGVASKNFGKWNGQSWSALPDPQPFYPVSSMHVFYDGQAEELYVGTGDANSFDYNGSLRAWDGLQWDFPHFFSGSSSIYGVFDMTEFDDGGRTKLVIGGRFVLPSDTQRNTVAAWDGQYWSQIGRGFDGKIYDMVTYDDGNGPAVYAAGVMGESDGLHLGHIARWEEGNWFPLGDGVGDPYIGEYVGEMVAFDDGSGPALFVAGYFRVASGIQANGFAKWNGGNWESLNGGITSNPYPVGYTLVVHNDGSGPALFVSGDFTAIGGVAANHVAKWDGNTWSSLGLGVLNHSSYEPRVEQLLSHDDGNGPALYVRGSFDNAGDASIADFARWRNGIWETVGGGPPGTVDQMISFDDGTGLKLHVLGYYDPPTGSNFFYKSTWNGSAWSTPVSQGNYGGINDIAVYDDGCGPALHASGTFYYTPPGSGSSYYRNGIARLQGSTWQFRAPSPVDQVNKLLVVDEDGQQLLYASGGINFDSSSAQLQFGHIGILAPSVGGEDINQDMFIDLYDHATIAECLGGPVYPFPSECMNSTDIDADFDVDLADFAAFQNAFAG